MKRTRVTAANGPAEAHRSDRAAWLRAAVLGADDGIVSTASLVIGVAAAAASRNAVLVAGVAGLVAGATSMAAGEYVSVSSQRDAEQADIARERWELAADPDFEQAELAEIYVRRGLDRPLATTVAERLMEADPLASHVRDELGLQPGRLARPLQAQPGRAALRVTPGRGSGDGPDSPDRATGGRDRTLSGSGYGVATSTALVLVATDGRWRGQMSQRLRWTNGSPAHHLPRPQVRPA